MQNERELATILAALRMWQGHLTNTLGLPAALVDIAQDAGPMLCADEIDELCERINCEPEPTPRRYIAVKLCAPNDTSGNPRRGWLVYGDEAQERLLGWVEENYSGRQALYSAILFAEEHPGTGAPARFTYPLGQTRALQDSGRVRELCSINVAYGEVRAARTHGPVKL